MNFTFSSNETSDICDPYEAIDSVIAQVLLTTGYAVLIFLSFAGNALVIAVFYKRYDKLRTPVNYFIVSMAVSDLLVPIFVIPRRIKQAYVGWYSWLVGGIFGEITCKILHFTDELSVTVSSQSMVFIAAERFWAIVFPMKPPLISNETSPRFICFTWLFSMTFFFYYFFVHKLVYEDNVYRCIYELPQVFDSWEDLWKVDRFSLLGVFVIIPFVLMALFYTGIMITLYGQEKNTIHLTSEEQHRRAKKNQRITRMLLTVVVLFFISWAPYYIYFILQYFPPGLMVPCNFKKRFYLCVCCLNYVYTAINPLIYYWFNKTYRLGFREVLRCSRSCPKNCRRRKVEPNNNEQSTEY